MVPIGWPEILTMVVMYSATGFGVTIGFHRLLTHRSFETYRPLRVLLAILGSAAAQGMAIKWCAIHRRHHQESDREGDPHSPHLHGETVSGASLGDSGTHTSAGRSRPTSRNCKVLFAIYWPTARWYWSIDFTFCGLPLD